MRLDEINQTGYLIPGDEISDEIGRDLMKSNEIKDLGFRAVETGHAAFVARPFPPCVGWHPDAR